MLRLAIIFGLRRVKGAFSVAVLQLMRAMLLGPESIVTADTLIKPNGVPRLLFAKLDSFMFDEVALKQTIDVNGSSGNRPCKETRCSFDGQMRRYRC